MMKRKLNLLLAILLLLPAFLFLPVGTVSAASNNDLIDDSIFDNYGSMTAAQIDTWLNGFSGSCISTNSGFTASEPTGYTPTSSSFFGRYSYGSPVSAGTIIHDVSVAHQINPQVLLTKLQNEEGLVRGDGLYGCGATAITASVGYACTDSGTFSHDYNYTGADPYSDSSALLTPLYYRNGTAVNSVSGNCVNSNLDAGFSEQVVHAAWLLSFSRHRSEGQNTWAAVSGSWNHCDDNNTCPANMNIPASWACYSGLMTQGSYKRCSDDTDSTYYDGYASIDGSAVHLDNGSTAALYVYTPHFQSFDNIFTPWFGDPTTPCEGNGNLSGAKSGYKITPYQFSSGTTNLAFTIMNNTGSTCTEAHLWAPGYTSWAAHFATAMRASDPSIGTLINVGSPGTKLDNLALVIYSGGNGLVEVHKFSPNLQKFPGYYDVASNLSGVSSTSGMFVSGDFFGRGYNQLAYVLFGNGRGHTEIHVFDPTLTKAVGYYDVETNLTDVSVNSGTFVAGDFFGRGYDQLAYIVYDGSTNTSEVHVFNRAMTSSTMYEVPTNLGTASSTSGTFVAGDFLGRGYDQLAYVVYAGSSGRVEVHTFSADLRRGVGFQDIATNLTSFDIAQ